MDNISLFDIDTQEGTKETDISGARRIDVVKAEFVEGETLSWQELFEGYDKMYAITYSSGMGFICRLIKQFKQVEIIFGYDGVLSYSIQEIMAYQSKEIERIKEDAAKNKLDLIARLDNGSLVLRIATGQLSHEKIYLLEADDGRKRVVMGSANMSQIAFSGKQRENICYMDGDSAFDWYYGIYTSLHENSTCDITAKMLAVDSSAENMDELPISQMVKTRKVLTIESSKDPNIRRDIEFALDIKNMADKIAPAMPKADKNGKTLLSPEKIKQTYRKISDIATQEKELEKESPQFIIDMENKRVTLNGESLCLNPTAEEVEKDTALFLEYMNGYSRFHGEPAEMQNRYFVFSNWFFTTPFMAEMRYLADLYNHNSLPYPVFGLIYGKSKSGKTQLVETLLQMMLGQKLSMAAADFTRTGINALKRTIKGIPIIVDDMTSARFTQHAVEVIKNDKFGIAERLRHYPAVVISANEDVKSAAPEIVRRTVICRAAAELDTTEIIKSNIVQRVQKNIGTAFYRGYLRRMFDEMPAVIDEIKSDEENTVTPDILALSSRILCGIINEHGNGETPFYMRELSLNDYFGEKITGAQAIVTIQSAWRVKRSAFVVDKKAKQLRYNAGDNQWDARDLMRELPANLRAHKSQEWIVMDLDRAIDHFGIDFGKKQIFGRF